MSEDTAPATEETQAAPLPASPAAEPATAPATDLPEDVAENAAPKSHLHGLLYNGLQILGKFEHFTEAEIATFAVWIEARL